MPSVKVCQTDMARKMQSGLADMCGFDPENLNAALIATALDPQSRRQQFLSPQDTFKVQITVTVQSLAQQSNHSRSRHSLKNFMDFPIQVIKKTTQKIS